MRRSVKTSVDLPNGNGDHYFSNFLLLSNVLVDTKAGGVGDNTSAMGQLGVPNPRFAAVANSELVPGFALSDTPMADAHYQWMQDQTVRQESHVRLTAHRASSFTPLPLPDVLPLPTRAAPVYPARHSSRLVAKLNGR